MRPLAHPIALSQRHAAGSREQDSLPAAELPLRAAQDCRLPGSLSQHPIAGSSVHRILRKHGVNRLPANQKHQQHAKRWLRFEKAQPGHRLQLDVKFLERIPGKRKRLYQFTAIDDCTRIRILKIYDACNQSTAVRFIDEVIRRLPFRILVVQTDNGAEFQSKFHWHLDELDIRHVYIKPRTPRLNGKVERSHRVDNQEESDRRDAFRRPDSKRIAAAAPGPEPPTPPRGLDHIAQALRIGRSSYSSVLRCSHARPRGRIR